MVFAIPWSLSVCSELLLCLSERKGFQRPHHSIFATAVFCPDRTLTRGSTANLERDREREKTKKKTKQKTKNININILAGVSQDWVGSKFTFMCSLAIFATDLHSECTLHSHFQGYPSSDGAIEGKECYRALGILWVLAISV